MSELIARLRRELDEVNHPNRIEIDQDDLIDVLDRLDELERTFAGTGTVWIEDEQRNRALGL
jgi:hypothetical protein